MPEMLCQLCGGSGFTVVNIGGYSGAKACDCRVPTIGKALLERSGVPPAYSGCTLENFKTSHLQVEPVLFIGFANALLATSGYLREFGRLERPGLLIHGPHGTGKTHLGVAVLRTLIMRGIPGVFLDCGNMLEQVKATFGTNHKAEAYRAAMENDIVLLDDLGAQASSDWVKDTIGAVITSRCNERKATIVTTNLNPEDFAERLGDRAGSRLREMCKFVPIPVGADDFRKDNPVSRKRKGT